MNKFSIGLYLPPYPKKFHKNDKNKYIFCLGSFINHEIMIFKNLNIKYIIIPYNIDKKEIKKYTENIDGLFICGNFPGSYTNDEEHKMHYKTLIQLMKNVLIINEKRPLPVIGECFGYELLINFIENKKNYDKSLFKNLNLNTPLFYKKVKYLEKKYKNKISFFFIDTVFLMNDYSKTNYLKNDYDIISHVKINKLDIIDILKHKLFPIYLCKSHPIYDNPKLKDEFFYFMNLSYNQRLLYQKKNDTFKNLKYKTIKSPYLHEFLPKIRIYQI